MRIPRFILSLGLLVLAIGLRPSTVSAQTGAASLTGIINDQFSAAIR